MTDQHNPPHPGEFIKETYLEPLNLSIRKVAIELDVAASTFSRLIKGDSDLTPEMALRLSKAFGRTPESWMKMQVNYELFRAKKHINLKNVHVIYAHF